MKQKIRRRALALTVLTAVMALMGAGVARADAEYTEIVCLGNDLSASQKTTVLDLMGLTYEEAEAIGIVNVTIEDERSLLGDYISADKIGSRSLSSVYIEQGASTEGIQVETHNITYVTSAMYTNAMITAGIENAYVTVAAPTKVSGTAALAGIYKAYETMVGEELEPEAKSVAGQELITTADLADYLGSDEAAALIAEIKATVLDKAITDPDSIRQSIRDIAASQNITLTDEQVEQILSLMQRLAQLDLDPQKLANQLTNLQQTLQGLEDAGKATQGFFARVTQFFVNIGQWFANLFGR